MSSEPKWTLSTTGRPDELADSLKKLGTARHAAPHGLVGDLPEPYTAHDVSPFAPSGAVYFMDGGSDAQVRLLESGEHLAFKFADQNTSIAASAPVVYAGTGDLILYTPAPPPLRSSASLPENTPDPFLRPTSTHLLQVISMNMQTASDAARLLIGLPYAEEFPELFYRGDLFGITRRDRDASSYGIVQSLTEYVGAGGERNVEANGYPARSFFAIYHIIDTPIGALFNKKATQMELQPNRDHKLALRLPPMPFRYDLINGPIPLFHVDDPDGDPVAELLSAHHHDSGAALAPTERAWPWHQPDLDAIAERVPGVDLREG